MWYVTYTATINGGASYFTYAANLDVTDRGGFLSSPTWYEASGSRSHSATASITNASSQPSSVVTIQPGAGFNVDAAGMTLSNARILVGGNDVTAEYCPMGDTDPLGAGVTGPSGGVAFGANPSTLPPATPHCVAWVSEVDQPTACYESDADRDLYVAAIEAAGIARWLGTHFSQVIGYSSSLAIIGSGCDLEVNLNGTAWDDDISSTKAGCPAVEHWSDFTGGTPPIGPSGDMALIAGTDRQALPDFMDDRTSGLRYLVQVPKPDPFVYVALDDSFAAGEGSDRFTGIDSTRYESGDNYPDSLLADYTLTQFFGGNACHRSLVNYAKINRDRFEPAQPSVLVDRTCSGALAFPENGGIPITARPEEGIGAATREEALAEAQLNQALWTLDRRDLSGADVDLLTVSMGGNDMGFADLVTACIVARLVREAVDTAEGLSAILAHRMHLDLPACALLDPIVADTGEGLEELARELPSAHDHIGDGFYDAMVFQVNHPAFLPRESEFAGDTCSGIDSRDAAYALSIASRLNSVIDEAVTASNARHEGRFTVVDIENQFGANPLCPDRIDEQYFVSVPFSGWPRGSSIPHRSPAAYWWAGLRKPCSTVPGPGKSQDNSAIRIRSTRSS